MKLLILSMKLGKESWSKGLKDITPTVKDIFYKGNIDLLLDESPKLAVVGSRRMTDYGLWVIEKWMPVLVSKGITIVSGFMYGVDQAAHKACLSNGGKTVAVLGWGIENKVSAEDEDLYQKILEVDSLILSEWQMMEANVSTFPQRNRIVAGISDAVLVVEGANKSGSLITARLAKQFGKTLMAVPGLVTSRVADGTNGLIKNGKAVMVTCVEDVLTEMGLSTGQMSFPIELSADPIVKLLSDSERGVDEIAKILGLELPELLRRLTELSLKDVIVETDGKFRLG